MKKKFEFYEQNLDFFFSLSEKVDAYIGKTKINLNSGLMDANEIIEIELEKLERIDTDACENSIEIIFSLCFGLFF